MSTTTAAHLPARVLSPLFETFAAEVEPFDLASLDDSGIEAIKQLVYEQKLVVFRGQELADEEYIAFARRLGRPEPYFQEHYHHPDHPEIFVSSNVPVNGQKVGVAGTGRFWHSDYSFMEEPLSMTMIRPVVLPEGKRGTCFIDMELAYRELPEHLRQAVEGRRSLHDARNYYKVQPGDVDRAIIELVEEFHALSPGVWQPMVLTHPVSGEKALFVSRGFTLDVEGMRHEEAQALLTELFDRIERPERVYVHDWAKGDLLMWDNRSLIHRAAEQAPGQKSCSYRISLYDGLPFDAA